MNCANPRRAGPGLGHDAIMKQVRLGSFLRSIAGRNGRVSKYKAIVDRIHREEADALRVPLIDPCAVRARARLLPEDLQPADITR